MCSPRNTLAGYKALFNALDVKFVLAGGASPIVDTIVNELGLRQLSVPSVDELVSGLFPHYPYDRCFITSQDEPLVVLHTSGTTALPKPIIITHNWVSNWAQAMHQKGPPGTQGLNPSQLGNRVLVLMPPFHAGNIMPTLFDAVHNQTTIIFPLANSILAPEYFPEHFMGCLQNCRTDIAIIPGGFIQGIAQSSEILAMVEKHLDYMCYTGGDVADCDGDVVARHVKLFNINGSTETASYVALRPSGAWDRSIWKYLMPHAVSGIDFRCSYWDAGDAKYELVVVRNTNPEDLQPVFSVYPELTEYHSGDLFSPHPTIPGLWKYRGRSDDCFVLATGSNINPLTMEDHVSRLPEVKGALMFGQRLYRPGVLIELANGYLPKGSTVSDGDQHKSLVHSIWLAVERGNQEYYDLARVTLDRIIFTTPDRPMQRTPKGTVRRKTTLDLYEVEIGQLEN